MKRLLYIALIILASPRINAQDTGAVRFIHAGLIEYEQKEDLKNLYKGDGEISDAFRKLMPEYKLSYYNLTFNGRKSLFAAGRDNPDNLKLPEFPGSTNTVYADRNTNQHITQRVIWGANILESDTIRNLHWRITGDIRAIAGFECHRATTVILDSVFVVAFYCDEILPDGGPEGFGGLPGTILGLVIPKLHTSWYATKLIVKEPTEKDMLPPKKGQKMTTPELATFVKSKADDYGDFFLDLRMHLQY
jgi:GLPGLI family protein